MPEIGNVLTLLDEVKTFSQRRSILNQLGFTSLGEGSGRSVFEIDPKRIIKVAKNPKGQAQNEAEAGLSPISPILAKVIQEGENSDWVIAQNAKKVTKAMFKSITKMDFDIYSKVMVRFGAELTGAMWMSGDIDHEDAARVESNPFFEHIAQVMSEGDLAAGDLGRINSYGVIDGRVVLRDYGLTREVFRKYYNKKKKKVFEESSW